MNTKSKLSRIDFIKTSAIGAGALLLPSSALGNIVKKESKKASKNEDIHIGFIGLGQQAMHLLNGFITIPGVRVVAGSDVYAIKCQRFKQRVDKYYSGKKIKSEVSLYEDFRELIARDDIDAVVIATPDHQHAHIAIAACNAKKDVYLEKPLTFTIYEGQQLRKAVRQNNRILQVGSQQRSSAEFIHATTLAREGALGKIHLIKAYVGDGPVAYKEPKEEVPSGLNWDLWLGPLPRTIHYNHKLNPVISLNPEKNEQEWGGWRWYKGMGGGYTTDWGAHMFDVSQWAIGKDGSGPVEIIPPGYSHYSALTFKYDNGIVVSQEKFDADKRGVKIYGDNGWIQVCRGEFLASDPQFMPTTKKDDDNMPYETKVGHYQVFIDSIRSRIDPNVPVETGHTSCTMCTLGNIAYELKRPLHWNPIVEKFVNDPQATQHLHYQYTDGYKLFDDKNSQQIFEL